MVRTLVDHVPVDPASVGVGSSEPMNSASSLMLSTQLWWNRIPCAEDADVVGVDELAVVDLGRAAFRRLDSRALVVDCRACCAPRLPRWRSGRSRGHEVVLVLAVAAEEPRWGMPPSISQSWNTIRALCSSCSASNRIARAARPDVDVVELDVLAVR